jgi:hypothetical protein
LKCSLPLPGILINFIRTALIAFPVDVGFKSIVQCRYWTKAKTLLEASQRAFNPMFLTEEEY